MSEAMDVAETSASSSASASRSIPDLEAAAASNPYDEETTLSLIRALSNAAKAQEHPDDALVAKCEAYRTSFADRFLPTTSFWLDWIADTKAQPQAAQSGDTSAVDALFERALTACPHHLLLMTYIEDMQDRLEAELISEQDMRQAFEKAVSLGGTDLPTGAELWSLYCSFETEEHRDEVEVAETQQELNASKQRMIRAFHRQLALPLRGNEAALAEFEKVLEELCIESDVTIIDPNGLQRKVAAALKEREAREKIESQLADETFLAAPLADRVRKWRWYIKFENKAEQLSRVQRLYERAVMDCRASEELWTEAAAFAAHSVRNWPLLESVTLRALKPCYNSITLWRYHLLSLEALDRPDSDVAAAVQRSLLCGFAQPDDYLCMLQLGCDYRMRRLRVLLSSKHAAGDKDAALGRVREAYDQAEAFLGSYYSSWLAGWLQLFKRRVASEDDIFSLVRLFDASADSSASVAVWERAVEALAPHYHGVWQQYIAWALARGDEALCRALYRRAVGGKDNPNIEALCVAWVAFEQQCGSFDEIISAMGKTGPILSHWAWRKTQAAAEEQGAASPNPNPNPNPNTNPNRGAASNGQQQTNGGANDANPNPNRTLTASDTGNNGRNGKQGRGQGKSASLQGRKRTHDESNGASSRSADDPAACRQKQSEAGLEDTGPAPAQPLPAQPLPAKRVKVASDDPRVGLDAVTRTAHVKNIIFRATTEQITTHFATQCGDLQEVHVVLSKAGKFRGIAFITFLTHEAYDKALALNGTKLYSFDLCVGPCDKDDDDAAVSVDSMDYIRNNYKRIFSLDRAQGHYRKEPKEVAVGSDAASSSSSVPPSAPDASAAAKTSMTTVFVSKIPLEYTSAELRAIFEPCGTVVEAKVFTDKKTGVSKRVGIVQFADEDAKLAAFALNKTSVGGHKISVAPSKFEWTEAKAMEPLVEAPVAPPVVPPSRPLSLKPRTLKMKI